MFSARRPFAGAAVPVRNGGRGNRAKIPIPNHGEMKLRSSHSDAGLSVIGPRESSLFSLTEWAHGMTFNVVICASTQEKAAHLPRRWEPRSR